MRLLWISPTWREGILPRKASRISQSNNLSHNQNRSVLKWPQNHASRFKADTSAAIYGQGIHLPESVLSQGPVRAWEGS